MDAGIPEGPQDPLGHLCDQTFQKMFSSHFPSHTLMDAGEASRLEAEDIFR